MPRPRKHPEHEIHLGPDGYAYDRKQRHRQIIAARGNRCELCAWTGKVAVDHRDGDKGNYAPENLRILCVSCNVKEQHKRLTASNATWNNAHWYLGRPRMTPRQKAQAHRRACRAYYDRRRHDPAFIARRRENESRYRQRRKAAGCASCAPSSARSSGR